MNAQKLIENNSHFVTDEGDVICNTPGIAITLPISEDSEINKSLKLTEQIVSDVVKMTKSKFVEKYEHEFDKDSSLTCLQYYRKVKQWIVDEKVPLSKSKSKKPKSKNNKTDKSVKKGSRKDQVAELLSSGMTSPTKIANKLGTNAGYVSRLIKQINESSN